jgi:histidinol phosphatase-like enzyme (inositol monophosphatase family)
MEEEFASSLDEQELSELKKFGILLAEESAKIIRQHFKQDIAINLKSDLTPVTVADYLSEEKIRSLINKEFPEHGILGEEFGVENECAKFKWIIDPIDGTKSFITGSFDFGTLIALTENEYPILGFINQPVVGELVIGDNACTTLNGRPIRVRPCYNLSDAILLTTDLLTVGRFQNPNGFNKLTSIVKFARTYGNSFGYTLVASGLADIMIDPIMSTWDLMALIPIIQGAGGSITDYFGNNPIKGNSIVACSKTIHSEVIKLLNDV